MKLFYLVPLLVLVGVLISHSYGKDRLLEGEEALEQAVLHLLDEQDVAAFVEATTPTVADFKAEAARHGNDFEVLMEKVRESGEQFPEIGEAAPYIEASAVMFLKAGNDLGILSAEADWKIVRVTALDWSNRIDYRVHKKLSGFQAPEFHGAASEIRVVLERAGEAQD